MRARSTPLLAAATASAVLVGGAVWWQWSGGTAGSGDECPVATAARTAGAQLVPRAELVPAGTVGRERRPVVAAADRLGRALDAGTVLAGRFHESAAETPVLVPLDGAVAGHVLLAAAGPSIADPGGAGVALTSVELPGGDPAWSRSSGSSLTGGGLVGDRLVMLSADPAGVLTVDPVDGETRGCLSLDPAAGAEGEVRLLTDQAGPEVVVVADGGSGVTVQDVDPAAAAVTWQRELGTLTGAASVMVVPDEQGAVVAVGRSAADPLRLAELAAGDAATTPSLEVLALADGRQLWTWPDDGSVAASVGAAEGILVALVARESGAAARHAVVGLDVSGTERWRLEAGRRPVGVELWGDTVVLRATDRAGRPELRGLGLADGRPRWRLSLPAEVGAPLGPGLPVRGRYAVAGPDGVLLVDPANGEHRVVRTALEVDQLVEVGDMLLIRSGVAVLVLGDV